MPDQARSAQAGRGSRALAVVFAVVGLSGCQHYNAINFVTNTQVGAKIGVNAEKIPEIQVGYSRQEAARVPVYLMTAGDPSAAASPVVNALLSQASANLEKARQNEEKADSIALAKNQIALAAKAGAPSGAKAGAEPPEGLWVFLLAKSTSLTATSTVVEIELVRQLAEAQQAMPRFVAEFNQNAKFIGTRTNNAAADAYSVLGTFSGTGAATATAGSGPQAQGNGRIAQFFATGVAAQLLAKDGGADLVAIQPAANVHARELAKQQITEARVQAVGTNQKVAQAVTGLATKEKFSAAVDAAVAVELLDKEDAESLKKIDDLDKAKKELVELLFSAGSAKQNDKLEKFLQALKKT